MSIGMYDTRSSEVPPNLHRDKPGVGDGFASQFGSTLNISSPVPRRQQQAQQQQAHQQQARQHIHNESEESDDPDPADLDIPEPPMP